MNWVQLNTTLPTLNEQQVKDLLEEERAGARRPTFLERLHQRYVALRSARERAEIMAEAVQSRVRKPPTPATP